MLALAARRMIAPHVADLRRDGSRTRVVLVVDEITEQELFLAISLHVTSILREIDVVRLIKEIAACAVLLAGALPGSTAATADSPNAQPRTANAGGFWQPTRHFPELT
ncbi:MAG: hypothetical protein SYR96_02710 [Actinomycetota bacterium]|nr:hypothetical protein [Actinomycetota bacterium]